MHALRPWIRRFRTWRAGLDKTPPAVLDQEVEVEASAPIPARFLVGTITGLLFHQDGRFTRIFDGKVYGITSAYGRWYVFRQATVEGFVVGQIVSFSLEGDAVGDVRVDVSGLDREVHQIDFVDDVLYVTDTYNNRIWRYTLTAEGVGDRTSVYVRGKLQRRHGAMPDNYVHLNSIFVTPHAIHVLFHNQTRKTGKASELVHLDALLQEQAQVTLPASCAHNVIPTPDGFTYCDSFGQRLMVGNTPVFDAPCYVRGLAVSDSFVLLGGSDLADRNRRDQTVAYLFMIDRQTGALIGTCKIPSAGSVYEIRLIEPLDLGMSQHYVGEAELGQLVATPSPRTSGAKQSVVEQAQ